MVPICLAMDDRDRSKTNSNVDVSVKETTLQVVPLGVNSTPKHKNYEGFLPQEPYYEWNLEGFKMIQFEEDDSNDGWDS